MLVPPDNYIRTANKTGVTTRYRDWIAQAGIDFCQGKARPVLDIGCAYGVVSLPLLAQGNVVIANDTATEHLEGLRASVLAEQLARLSVVAGAFPAQPELAPESLSAVIAIWVFHFLDGPELERAARKIFAGLESGGKVFISASSPYLKFLQTFIPDYEQRKAAGEAFPGWAQIKNYLQPHQVENLPAGMHFLDPDVLRRVFTAAGFEIECAEFFKREDVTDAMFLDGRENVGLIARKP